MPNFPHQNSLILVAILPNPKDLEIARFLGWYRIPLRRAPKVIAVDYLAFYQPSSFGKRGGKIEFLAPVEGNELTTRAELLQNQPDHPRAREEYFKIQIGPLIQLENPIPAGKWRRITFFYTIGEYMENAETINDLVVQTEDRKSLWSALRERTDSDFEYQPDSQGELSIPPEVLALFGIIGGDDELD